MSLTFFFINTKISIISPINTKNTSFLLLLVIKDLSFNILHSLYISLKLLSFYIHSFISLSFIYTLLYFLIFKFIYKNLNLLRNLLFYYLYFFLLSFHLYCITLQSFPQDFIMYDNYILSYKQFAYAVNINNLETLINDTFQHYNILF
jgi:hypothetical protein